MSGKGLEMNDDLDPRDRALQAKLRETFDPVLDEPVPERLRALFGDREMRRHAAEDASAVAAAAAEAAPSPAVVDLEMERARRRGGWLAWGGIAASLVIGMAIGAKWLSPGSELDRAGNGDWMARGGLASALDAQMSGATSASGTRIGLSFVARDGSYCRAFTQGASGAAGIAGLACRENEGWRVRQLVAVAATDAASSSTTGSEGFRTAASPWPPALLASIDDLREGDALSADAERAAMTRGWRR